MFLLSNTLHSERHASNDENDKDINKIYAKSMNKLIKKYITILHTNTVSLQ